MELLPSKNDVEEVDCSSTAEEKKFHAAVVHRKRALHQGTVIPGQYS